MIQNSPDIWRDKLPRPDPDGHKYHRGHAVIYGGPEKTGAARLAAEACMRVGAGVCSVLAAEKSGSIYRCSLPAHIMVEDYSGAFSGHFSDERRSVALIGPGAGAGAKDAVLQALQWKKPCVLDADALTAFWDDSQEILVNMHEKCIVLPHEGEFKALFPDLNPENEDDLAKINQKTDAYVLIKGKNTRIFGKNGEFGVNQHASPYLATAGSGDVLAGMITGLIAQGVGVFDAALMASWMHGEAAQRFGPGLVASDLPELIPGVMKDLM